MFRVAQRVTNEQGIVERYVLRDVNGVEKILDTQVLLGFLKKKLIRVHDLNEMTVYEDIGRVCKVVGIDGDYYTLENTMTKEKKTLSKESLISFIKAGTYIVSNCFIRESKSHKYSLVCKDMEMLTQRIQGEDSNFDGYVTKIIEYPYFKCMFSYYAGQCYLVENKKGERQLRYKGNGEAAMPVYYKGELGEFSYDPTKFAVEIVYHPDAIQDRCIYIGSINDKIEIPKGIKNCRSMFRKAHRLAVAPEIPMGVESCFKMFLDCTYLKKAPKIPSTVRDCHYMFWGCDSLEEPPEIPTNVKYTTGMFSECIALKKAPRLHKGILDCSYMFEGCTSLDQPP